MESSSPPAPMKWVGNIADEWKRWKEALQYYLVATDLESKSGKRKVAILLTCIGEEGRRIFNTFDEADKNNYAVVVEKFDDFCEPKKHLIFERYLFFTLHQGNLAVDKWLTALKTQASKCEFGSLKGELILTQLAIGVTDKALKQRLLRKELNLEKAVAMMRAWGLSVKLKRFSAQ